MPQIQSEFDKNPKSFKLSKFSSYFCVLFEKLGSLECEKVSTRKKFVVQEASSKRHMQFVLKNSLKFCPILTKIQKTQVFEKFMQFFCFSKDLVAWIIEDDQQRPIRCSRGFCEEINADLQ